MAKIQIVLGEKLLKAVDGVAKRRNLNRSALICRALEEHLKRLKGLDLEAQLFGSTSGRKRISKMGVYCFVAKRMNGGDA